MMDVRTPCVRGMRYHGPGLAAFRDFCERLGNPQNHMGKIVHIAGTNGKGSTARYLAVLLQDRGYRVGVYTSPHYRSWTERIVVDGVPISQAELDDRLALLQADPVLDGVTPFEQLTLAAFLTFQNMNVDISIIETGIGGRCDATNVVQPECVVCTPVGLDHMDVLGPTLADIARQKAGIIKPGIPVFSAEQVLDVDTVLRTTASQNDAPYLVETVSVAWRQECDHLPAYLQENARLAWRVANHFVAIDDSAAIACLRHVRCPGRFSEYTLGAATVVCDAAHNLPGLTRLLEMTHQRFSAREVAVVLGVQKSRPAVEMVRAVQSAGFACYYCAFDPDDAWAYSDVREQVDVAQWELPFVFSDDRVYVCAGSIYFLGRFYDQFPECWVP